MCLGFKVRIFQRTGNSEQQNKEVKSVIRFNCSVGDKNWEEDVESKVIDFNSFDKYEPCPFYLRYQREEDDNIKSNFFLNDFCMLHSHPLNLSLSFLQQISMKKKT